MTWRVLVLVLLAMAVPAAAQDPLTLDEVLRRVEAFHPKLRGAQLELRIAEAKVLEKEGAFDPTVLMGTLGQRYQSPTAPGKPKYQNVNDVGVDWTTREGVKFLGGWRFNQGEVKAPLSLTGDGGEYFIEVKMPLLRGYGINYKSAALDQAEIGVDVARTIYRLTELDVLYSAAYAYWDWVAAARRLELTSASLDLARERASQVATRVRAGDLPRVDDLEAAAEVQRRLEALAKAQQEVQKHGLKLAFYLWEPSGEPAAVPSASQAMAALPVPGGVSEEALAQASLEAVEHRPELDGIDFEKRIVAVSRTLAENDRQPGLDLVMSPAYDTGFKSIGWTYKAGLLLSIPLATRDAEGRLLQAQLKDEKLDLTRAMEVRRILLEVQDAAVALRALQERYQAAVEALDLARRLEEAERLRYQLGEGTLFLVNQRERYTLEAALKVVDLEAEEGRVRAAFEAVQGTLGEEE